MERNMFAEQGCFQKRDSFLDFTVRRWSENGIMRSPLTTDFGESKHRLFWGFGFFFHMTFPGFREDFALGPFIYDVIYERT